MVDLFEALERLTAASVAGAAIGLDRHLRAKPMGVRTFTLIAIGSATMTMASFDFAFERPNIDAASRVIQGIITGIGFLGAGAIFQRGNNQVEGLTTAAAAW